MFWVARGAKEAFFDGERKAQTLVLQANSGKEEQKKNVGIMFAQRERERERGIEIERRERNCLLIANKHAQNCPSK